MSKFIRSASLTLMVVLLASCASQQVQDTWSNPYVASTQVEEIIELRGQPFDAILEENGNTILTFYGGRSKDNGWVWVPYVNMVTAGITTWITREQVTVSSDGYYLEAEGETKKMFQQMLVGLVQEANNLSDDYPDEMERAKDYMETLGLEFSENVWKGSRSYRRTWDDM